MKHLNPLWNKGNFANNQRYVTCFFVINEFNFLGIPWRVRKNFA
jgi:hypothetical protein